MDRLPLQLSCVESMLPLHSAIASATLISSLSSESDSWALVPQGGFGFPFQSFSPHLCARHLFVYFTGRKWYICIVLHNVKYIILLSEINAVDYKDFFLNGLVKSNPETTPTASHDHDQ